MTMLNDARNPPPGYVSSTHRLQTDDASCLPSHEHSEKDVSNDPAPTPPEQEQGKDESKLAFTDLIAALRVLGMMGALFQTAMLGLIVGAGLLDIMLGLRMTMVHLVRKNGVWNQARLGRGTGGVDDIVVTALLGKRGVVQVWMVVLARYIEGRVRVGVDARHGRTIVLARHVGHVELGREGHFLQELKSGEPARTQTGS
jgi:hypothetical protein